MSYLVLARKWRPQTFAEVVGQQAVVRTLKNGLARQRVAHAMIFSGVRGVGKTTLARIMAKALNCEGDTDPPCNECTSCREITSGTAIDLHEIDGASNRGIQEIRELKENIRFQPARSPYKIIIIDEVHMLTTEAFNALLKTLEEPPEHVYFMFATTELHKVPVTILSRCQRYELKRVTFKDLTDFFRKIADQEKVEISDTALEIIAREAGGSVRDGLSLLDQIFSFGGETVSDEDVTQVLGLVDSRIFEKLAAHLLAGQLAASFELLTNSYNQGIDLKRFSHDLLHYFRSLIVVKLGRQAGELLDVPDQDLKTMSDVASLYSVETLSSALAILLKGAEEMQYSSHPKMALEMSFIKIIEAGQVVPVANLLERLIAMQSAQPTVTAPESGTGKDVGSAAAPPPRPEPAKTAPAPPPPPEPPKAVPPQVKETPKAPPPEEPPLPEPREDDLMPVETAPEAAKPGTPSTVAAPEKDVQPPQAQQVAMTQGKDVRRHWDGFLAHVKDRKPWMASALNLCDGREKDGDLVLKFNETSDCAMLEGKDNLKLLNEFALDFFQKDMTVRIVVKNKENGTESGSEQSAAQEERRALQNDPLVQLTTEVLGGRVGQIRVGPRSR